MAQPGFNCSIKVQSSAVTMTAEATTTSDNITYQISDSSKRIIDLNTPVSISGAGTDPYVINYLTGEVVFKTADTRTIAVTGKYVSPIEVVSAKEYNVTFTGEALDQTEFGTRFKEFVQGLISGTASLSRYFVADDTFIDMLLNSEYKIFEFYVNDTEKVSAFALITNDAITTNTGGLVEESINLQLTTSLGAD